MLNGKTLCWNGQDIDCAHQAYELEASVYGKTAISEAELFYGQAVRVRQATLGLHHEETLCAMYYLAEAYLEQHRIMEAMHFYRIGMQSRRNFFYEQRFTGLCEQLKLNLPQ